MFVVAAVAVASAAPRILSYSILLIGPGLRLIRLTGDPGRSWYRFVLSYCIAATRMKKKHTHTV